MLREEHGYSLAEVMVSILLLSAAIIPMVGMFDVGLRSAQTSGNYDKARTFATERLEYAKSLPYDSPTSGAQDVRDWFPNGTPAPDGDGEVSSSPQPVPGLPSGSTYTVSKQYMEQPPAGGSFRESSGAADTKLMRITVTVNWSGKSYSTAGVVVG